VKNAKLFSIFLLMASFPLFWSCTPYMGGGGGMMGYGGYGGMFMWLIIVIAIAVVVYLVYNPNGVGGRRFGVPQESALDILKKRYAKGEISKEEFERLKQDLED